MLEDRRRAHRAAREKNRLFHLIWDITSSAAAPRIGMFENLNAPPQAALREELCRNHRSEGIGVVPQQTGLD